MGYTVRHTVGKDEFLLEVEGAGFRLHRNEGLLFTGSFEVSRDQPGDMTRVMIASPFRGDEWLNVQYAIACMMDCFARGEAPWAPHLIYPQGMRDDVPEERDASIAAGIEWAKQAHVLASYQDLGISDGMKVEMAAAEAAGVKVDPRTLPNWVAPPRPAPIENAADLAKIRGMVRALEAERDDLTRRLETMTASRNAAMDRALRRACEGEVDRRERDDLRIVNAQLTADLGATQEVLRKVEAERDAVQTEIRELEGIRDLQRPQLGPIVDADLHDRACDRLGLYSTARIQATADDLVRGLLGRIDEPASASESTRAGLQGVVDAVDRVLDAAGVHHASRAKAVEIVLADRDKLAKQRDEAEARAEVAEAERDAAIERAEEAESFRASCRRHVEDADARVEASEKRARDAEAMFDTSTKHMGNLQVRTSVAENSLKLFGLPLALRMRLGALLGLDDKDEMAGITAERWVGMLEKAWSAREADHVPWTAEEAQDEREDASSPLVWADWAAHVLDDPNVAPGDARERIAERLSDLETVNHLLRTDLDAKEATINRMHLGGAVEPERECEQCLEVRECYINVLNQADWVCGPCTISMLQEQRDAALSTWARAVEQARAFHDEVVLHVGLPDDVGDSELFRTLYLLTRERDDAVKRADKAEEGSPKGPDTFQALAESAYALASSQGWRRDWEGAGCYLLLEAAEFIEALRGKGSSTALEEAGDVLFVLLSTLVAHNIPLAEVLSSLRIKIRDYVPKVV